MRRRASGEQGQAVADTEDSGRHAAAYSPRCVQEQRPARCPTCARVWSARTRSRRVRAVRSRSAAAAIGVGRIHPVEHVDQPAASDGPQHLVALVDGRVEDRLRLEQLSPHAGVLRSLSGEQKRDAWRARSDTGRRDSPRRPPRTAAAWRVPRQPMRRRWPCEARTRARPHSRRNSCRRTPMGCDPRDAARRSTPGPGAQRRFEPTASAGVTILLDRRRAHQGRWRADQRRWRPSTLGPYRRFLHDHVKRWCR